MPNIVRTSFSMGELSPRMLGRADLRSLYQQGLRRFENWILDDSGSAMYRAGTQFARALAGGSAHRLIPFNVEGHPALIYLTAANARVYYTASPTANFDLLDAVSNTVTLSRLTAERLRTLQWVQRPFNAIAPEGWLHRDTEDYDTLTAAGNTDPRGGWSDGTETWIADRTAGRLFVYNSASRAHLRTVNITLDADGDAIANHAHPTGIWGNGVHMFVAFEDVDDYIAAFRLGETVTYDSASNVDGLAGIQSNRVQALEGDGTHILFADTAASRVNAYEIETGARAAAQDYTKLARAGCTHPIGLWLSQTHLFVLHNPGSSPKVFAFDRDTREHDPDVDVPSLASSNSSPWDLIGSAEVMWVTNRTPAKVFGYREVSPEDPETAVYLFHPDIEPILLEWDSDHNRLSQVSIRNAIGTPAVVGDRPAAGTFFEQRLVVGGGDRNPQSIAGTRTPDPESGQPRYRDWALTTETGSVIGDQFHSVQTVFATNAFAYTLFSEIALRIRWIIDQDEVICIGCDKAVYFARELAPDTPPIIRLQAPIGAAAVTPVLTAYGVCYASTDRRRVYAAFSKRNLTAYAGHLFKTDRIAEMAWVQNPVQRLWVRTDSGKLRVLTIHQENGVMGWSPITLGGGAVVRSMAVGHGDDDGDALWLAVERGGTTYLEVLREPTDEAHSERIYLDSSLQARSGLSHLNGVAGLVAVAVGTDADQKQTAAPATVAGGNVTTAITGTVRVGIPYTADLQPPQLAVDVDGEGSGFGEAERVSRVSVAAYRSYGCKVGPRFDDYLLTDLMDPAQTELHGTDPDDLVLEPKTLHPLSSDLEALVALRQDQPQPFNLLFIEMEVGS